jgi:hypothetical protein
VTAIPERIRLSEVNDLAMPKQRSKPLWGPLSDVEMKPVRWLSRPFWQADAFHLLVGEKGCGKGTFLAGLAAKITWGGQRVLWVAAGEDSLAIDVKPRIIAAGGDPELVMVPHKRLFLPGCVNELLKIGSFTGDVGLIVLDPIVGLMKGGDSNADGDIRSTIDPLNGLADELGCPVVGVRHLGKDTQRQALHRVLGGVDWVNVPRAVVAIAVDDEDVRHVAVLSGNRVPPGENGRSFQIVSVDLGDGITSTRAKFSGVGKDIDDVLSTPKQTSKSRLARELILDILENEGQQESDALTARVAHETGLAAKTIKNEKTALKDAGLVNWKCLEEYPNGKCKTWALYRSLAPRPGRGGDKVQDSSEDDVGTSRAGAHALKGSLNTSSFNVPSSSEEEGTKEPLKDSPPSFFDEGECPF